MVETFNTIKYFLATAHNETSVKTNKQNKTYKCESCDLAFATVNALKVHRLDHYGVTPYPCDKCEMKFSTKARLNVHQAGKIISNA